MPFLAPVAVGATFGTLLTTFVVNTAISIGISLIASKIAAKFAKKKGGVLTVEGGTILDTLYGANTPRYVAIGKCAAVGLACYDNSFSTANKRLQRVYKLSDWYTTELTRVAINGEWVTIGALDATLGYPVTSGDLSGLAWVKFHDGRDTTADSYLVDNANPSTRWTADHKGIAISYVVLTLDYNEEKLVSIPEVIFEFTGAPLYDFRLDTSVGGSGSHRFNDVTTWEYSANPILADYCYRRGFYTGTYGSGEDVFCGMAMPVGDLPLTPYSAAANICDEIVDSENRYVVSLMLDATAEHGDNIESLMTACAGMVVDAPTGAYPILGAAQTPVATLTNDDLVADADVTFTQKRPESELVNSVSGTYIEPDFIYADTGYEQQTDAAAVTLDRRSLDFNLNFPQVPSKRQAEQLASIYFNENRFEAQKVCTLRPKWQRLEIGDWISWTGDEDGEDRDYQIVAMSVSSIDAESPRIVQVTLQERHADIYAGIGTVTAPFTVFRNDPPAYLSEVANFAVLAVLVEADNGARAAAIRASWDTITDPTVANVLVEWRVRDQSPQPVFREIVPAGQITVFLQDGVVGETVYEVRTQLLTIPLRATTPSAWVEVTTLATTLENQFNEVLQAYADELARLRHYVKLGTSEGIIETAAATLFRRVLSTEIDGVSAAVVTEQEARVDGDTALASDLTAVEAIANAGTASGLVKLEVASGPAGVTARFGVYLRASVGDGYDAEAAEFLDILSGGGTRKVIISDNTVLQDTAGNVFALFGGADGAYFENARIANLEAENISLNGVSIGNSVSVQHSSSTSTLSSSWVTISGASVVVNVAANAKLLILAFVYVTNDATQISVQVAIDGVGVNGDDTTYGFWGNNNEVGGGICSFAWIAEGLSTGNHTITLEWQATAGTATARTRAIQVVQLFR